MVLHYLKCSLPFHHDLPRHPGFVAKQKQSQKGISLRVFTVAVETGDFDFVQSGSRNRETQRETQKEDVMSVSRL